MKLAVEEPESAALAAALDALEPDTTLVSSWLLYTELHCAAARRNSVDGRVIREILDPLVLLDIERDDLLSAPDRGRGLRSQDAIHLAAALRASADAMVTYDAEQAVVARRAGLTVLAPGAAPLLERLGADPALAADVTTLRNESVIRDPWEGSRAMRDDERY